MAYQIVIVKKGFIAVSLFGINAGKIHLVFEGLIIDRASFVAKRLRVCFLEYARK